MLLLSPLMPTLAFLATLCWLWKTRMSKMTQKRCLQNYGCCRQTGRRRRLKISFRLLNSVTASSVLGGGLRCNVKQIWARAHCAACENEIQESFRCRYSQKMKFNDSDLSEILPNTLHLYPKFSKLYILLFANDPPLFCSKPEQRYPLFVERFISKPAVGIGCCNWRWINFHENYRGSSVQVGHG